ncbi:SCO3242 family prenyltransferase [Streptomyces sp. NPDC048172]|uniref:SCO3242 family prenyltransferase n=1 Tax=Streptomyces sp. NPDC048172 TaxID=3365505 RepID=UPI00371B1C59
MSCTSAASRTSGPAAALGAWAQLLRVSAVLTVPGDALAGTVAGGRPVRRGTLLAAGSSLCLYEAGMALNDWADRDVDAVERPDRPLPSGRVAPAAALGAAGLLTGAGLALAARAGRPALVTATALAGAVWAYDLHLKNTRWGPLTMGTARALNVGLGAAASGARGRAGNVLGAAALMGAHTVAVTGVSREEVQGGSPLPPLAGLAAVAGVTGVTARRSPVAAAAYAVTAARPLFHAALNPSPPLLQKAVGGGIRAMIPLQSALSGKSPAATALLGLLPLARRLSRKVSPT